jgi:pyrimidine operon attenuation protein / uracil phosphoribosyltransferase
MKQEQLVDSTELGLILDRMAAQIRERHRRYRELAVVGIRRGGDHLAQRLAARVGATKIGAIDITLYRDDLQSIAVGNIPQVHGSEIGFEVEGADVLLVDDVLFSGRTVRAAIDELFDYGRPARVQLAVLVDRGGRELPIAADYVGLSRQVLPPNSIVVHLAEEGAEDGIFLVKP